MVDYYIKVVASEPPCEPLEGVVVSVKYFGSAITDSQGIAKLSCPYGGGRDFVIDGTKLGYTKTTAYNITPEMATKDHPFVVGLLKTCPKGVIAEDKFVEVVEKDGMLYDKRAIYVYTGEKDAEGNCITEFSHYKYINPRPVEKHNRIYGTVTDKDLGTPVATRQ